MSMKTNKIYEGKNYKFKKNSILKTRIKYDSTYHYVLTNSLKYKKYINEFEKRIKIDDNDKFNKNLLKAMESTAKDLDINTNRIYNYNSFNKSIIKSFYKVLKKEKKNQIKINMKLIKLYKMIEEKKYKDLRELSINKPNDFLKAIYLYTICED